MEFCNRLYQHRFPARGCGRGSMGVNLSNEKKLRIIQACQDGKHDPVVGGDRIRWDNHH